MQLVVSGNRILAHGEGFLAMGGTVINTNTGRVYQNATVVTCDGCPSDIDKVGYEYHAGQFVPCAPFGVGDGNFAVVCGEDCKSIKDSGLPLSLFLKNASGSYVGTGTAGADNPNVLTFDFVPKILFVSPSKPYLQPGDNGDQGDRPFFLINGITKAYVDQSSSNVSSVWLHIAWDGQSVSWYHDPEMGNDHFNLEPDPVCQYNEAGETYYYVAIGEKGEMT